MRIGRSGRQTNVRPGFCSVIQRIQEDLAAVKRQGESNAHTLNDLRINFAVLDGSLTREFEIVKQDVRMIRSTIEDMGNTPVTEGEVTVAATVK